MALGLTFLSWIGLWILVIRVGGRPSPCVAPWRSWSTTPTVRPACRRHVWVPFLFRRPEARVIKNVVYPGWAVARSSSTSTCPPRGRRLRCGPPSCRSTAAGGSSATSGNRASHCSATSLPTAGGIQRELPTSPAATFPEHLIDLKAALVWIRAHADDYGIDPDFIAVTGGSAGGHLTALMALTMNDPEYQPGFEDADTSVQAAVPFYGVYDFTDRLKTQTKGFLNLFIEPYVMKAYLADEPEKFAKASPIDRVCADAPPFFVLHGDRDTLAPLEDARLFVERLRATSTQPVVYAELRGAQHAFDIFVSPRTAPVIEGVERFLDGVHHDWLRGLEGAAEGAVTEGSIVADGSAGEDVDRALTKRAAS